MSSSTDSLKKKVCVTVFLDELFEEVLEEDRKDLKEVSEVTGSKATVVEKLYKEPSQNRVDKDENVAPISETEQPQILLRPRKHRRESKFSKNRYDSFKKELSKYGCVSRIKPGNDCCEPESAISDSDFELEEFLHLDKWATDNRKSSYTEISEIDVTEESFLSINPILSSMMISPSNKEKNKELQSVLCNHKSTQFDGAEKRDERIGDDVSIEKEEQKTAEDILAWKNTQRQIQLILTKAKNKHLEKETCEGDRIRRYDLTSILEDCVRRKGNSASEATLPYFSSDLRANISTDVGELSDSYTCVFPHNRRTRRSGARETDRVWSRGRRNPWNDGFETDMSEVDCPHLEKRIEDDLLCYALCWKCRNKRKEKKQEKSNSGPPQSAVDSESISRESSLESIKSKSSFETDFLFRTVTHLANKTVLGAILKAEQEEAKKEVEVPAETIRKFPAMETRNKNFAEGDTIEMPVNQDPNFMLDFEKKEKLLLCDDVFLKNVEQTKGRNEIIVNRAEIKLNTEELVEKAIQPCSTFEGPTKVLFRQIETGCAEETMTDAESEMVFAESQNSCGNEALFGEKYLDAAVKSIENKIGIFEDEFCRSNMLKRMRTKEILRDDSLKEMKNMSTEVILICENISDNEISLETWQSSASTLWSLTEMGQCYLKDAKDNAMYLIEIPLHLAYTHKERHSESELFSKVSDSD